MTNNPHTDVLSKLGRVIVWANDKGGVGKTSCTTNCAGQFARNGFKVLIIDMNNQGNAVYDLGCKNHEVNDNGLALFQSLASGVPLEPKKVPGRDNLYIITGGKELEDISFLISLKRTKKGKEANLILQKLLVEIAPEFDLIFIDTPPENLVLLDLALAASRWLMIPTRTDASSIEGMQRVSEQFALAKEINPRLQLMGAVLFATTRSASRIHANAYEQIEAAFGGRSPSFKSFIGHSEALAQVARDEDEGKLAHELETLAKEQPAWWEALRNGEKPPRIPLRASNISTDYSNVCLEMINIINRAEKV